MVDRLHGVDVADPYRWLEDGESPEVSAWVAAQNERTRGMIDSLPDRARWHQRLVELLGAGSSIGCRVAGDRVFTMERWGSAPQFVLVVRSAVASAEAPRVLLDPAGAAADGTGAIDWFHPSWDGSLVAYGLSEGGDERSTLRVLDVVSGEHLGDEIHETRAASVAWLPDASGFLYTRYPEGDEYHRMVYSHTLGRPPQDDPLVWGELPKPEAWPDIWLSPDGRHGLVHVLVGWGHVDVYLWDREADTWNTVVEGHEAISSFVVVGDRLIGTTTLGAPRGRVVVAPVGSPSVDRWETLVPEGEAVIDGVAVTAEDLLVRSTHRALARLHRYDHAGAGRGEIALADLASFAGFDADVSSTAVFCQIESFVRPPTLLRWSPAHGLEPWGSSPGGDGEPVVDPGAFRVSVDRYPSLDGTEIGLFLVHPVGADTGPRTRCILTGYGGFAIASTPAWSPAIAAWCEQGGLYAVAGLRGGYEEGDEWHHAGRRDRKQNVFDDFVAAADWLVRQGLTSREHLALRGGSNGGLLVGAALTQRPDLARAVHCAVPLLDMIRYSRFLIARLWTDEYGDPDVPEEFRWLLAYSPYHRVVPGTCYPAVLFTAAEGDTRVDPLHARKMTAALQWASTCQEDRPILLRQEGRAGHGVGKPLQKQADELADVLAFLDWALG
jgi:prolyl oligopeptidase